MNVKEILKLFLEGQQLSEEQLQALKDFIGSDENQKASDETNPEGTKPDETEVDEEENHQEESSEETEHKDPEPSENEGEGEKEEEKQPGEIETKQEEQPPIPVEAAPIPPTTPPLAPPNFDEQVRELRDLVSSLRSEVENVRMLVIENTKQRQVANGPTPSSPQPSVAKEGKFFDF